MGDRNPNKLKKKKKVIEKVVQNTTEVTAVKKSKK